MNGIVGDRYVARVRQIVEGKDIIGIATGATEYFHGLGGAFLFLHFAFCIFFLGRIESDRCIIGAQWGDMR